MLRNNSYEDDPSPTLARLRLRSGALPGSPDIVFISQKIAIFVDGCFWHGCPKHGVLPSTNDRFWSDKIKGNQARDKKVTKDLRKLGWRVVRLWEHDLKKDVTPVIRSIDRIVRGSPAASKTTSEPRQGF